MTPEAKARSYIVIGGGLVGAASALRLQAAGFTVTLVDPGDPRRGASFGNIGHIAAEQCEPLASPASLTSAFGRLFGLGGPLDFRLRDIGRWGPWSARFIAHCLPGASERNAQVLARLLADPLEAWERLLTLGGQSQNLVRPSGHAVVWMDPAQADAGRAAWRRARIGTATLRDMTPEELAAYEPALKRPPVAGLMFNGTGKVSEPQAVRDALLKAFAARGGVSVLGEALAVSDHATGVRVTLKDGMVLEAEGAVIAAGAWSAPLMRQLGAPAPLIGERGYSLQSAQHAWPADLPLTVFHERSLVVARFDGGLRASSHVEFGDPSAPPDPRKWRALRRHVDALGIAFADQPDRWCGPRPTLPDYLPAIGRLKAHPRILYALGHQHLGLTLAASTAERIEALALGQPAPPDAEALAIERFSRRT